MSVDALCAEDPSEGILALGSFWPNSRASFESHLVKALKESNPVSLYQPHVTELCRFYASATARGVGDRRFDWVCRVLSSSETQPEHTRPQSLLVDCVCRRLGARDITHLFHKTSARPSMRMVSRLSGSGALRNRVRYVLQDLFIARGKLGGSVLLLDDIMNTGASMRVYARALRAYAGIESVYGLNLAVTRFANGKDGRGMLKLDYASISDHPSLRETWIDADNVFHSRADCRAITGRACTEVRFVAARRGTPCAECLG